MISGLRYGLGGFNFDSGDFFGVSLRSGRQKVAPVVKLGKKNG